MADQYVFVFGDAVDGLGFVGPVQPDDSELENEFDHETWLYAPMESREDALGRPDPEQAEIDAAWHALYEAIELADDMYHPDEVNIGLNVATDLAPLLALRDIITAWRAIPDDD